MRIIIATERRPKIEGTKQGVATALRILGRSNEQLSFETRAVESGVASTPRTTEDTMTGARNRAIGAYPEIPGDTLSIGLEGGLFKSNGCVFLQSWACVYDGTTASFGASGAIQLPGVLGKKVMVDGEELGSAIDDFAGGNDIRSGEGTWGVLTNNAVTREDSFALAVLNALMPILNVPAYKGNGR